MENKTINELMAQLSLDPNNPELSLKLAVEYERIGQTASAVSFYLRAAEYGYHTHGEHVYAALLQASNCFDNQKGREHTVLNLIEKAIAYSPKRPEAWFFLARYYERRQKWQTAYTTAEVGISNLPSNFEPLPIDIGYPDFFCLFFEKAVAGWWVGRKEESKILFHDLLDNCEMPEEYVNSCLNNLRLF